MFSYLKKLIYSNYGFYILSSSIALLNIHKSPSYIIYPANILYVAYFCSNFYTILNAILEFKIKMNKKFIKFFYGDGFRITEVYLYTDLTTNYDVSNYIDFFLINRIDVNIIDNLYDFYNIKFHNNEHIRLKFIYYFNGDKFISYFPFYKINIMNGDSMILNKNYHLPLPLFSDLIMENYRKNIVYPTYSKLFNEEQINNNFAINNKIYNLFNRESKNISTLTLNNIFNKELLNYFKMIRTPFNDFGILYNCPVRLIWVLVENNISISDFKNFYIKFWEPIFDEINLTLKDHFINLDNLNSIIISEHMKEILSK